MTSNLHGLRVVVCRPAHQAVGLIEAITDLGGVGVSLPLLEVAAPADGGRALSEAVARLADFDWLILTSANAVGAVADQTHTMPGSVRLAVVGPATARAARQAGWDIAFEPSAATAETLAAELPLAEPPVGARVLAPLAELAHDTLERILGDRGAAVERVDAYRMVTPDHPDRLVHQALAADVAVLSSPSTADRLAALARRHGDDSAGTRRLPPAVVIGPSTERAARTAGFDVLAVADPHTEAGLVAALVRSIGS